MGVRVYENGKKGYCNFVLGLTTLYRIDGGKPEEADRVTVPEYSELIEACFTPAKGVEDIVPLAEALARTYMHF